MIEMGYYSKLFQLFVKTNSTGVDLVGLITFSTEEKKKKRLININQLGDVRQCGNYIPLM